MNNYLSLNQKYPFFTIGRYITDEFVGIIQNSSKNLVSMYAYNLLLDDASREKFILLGEEWWWSSNRTVPVDIFLRPDFDIFKPCLRHFSAKEFTVIHGPVISLSNLVKRRIKRKTVELMRHKPEDNLVNPEEINLS